MAVILREAAQSTRVTYNCRCRNDPRDGFIWRKADRWLCPSRATSVEFTQEPVEQPYGVDVGLRDRYGRHIRIGPFKAGSCQRES